MVKCLKLLVLLMVIINCKPADDEKEFNTIYLTTNSNDVYAFNIANKTLIWHFPAFNEEVNDELCFFSIVGEELIKSYQDGTIIQFNKRNGEIIKKFQDQEDKSQSYYGYDFTNVAFLQFYQYPQIFQGNAIFANSHGEIKSINLKTENKNWIYIQNQIIYSSPKIAKNIVYVNTNFGIVALDAKTGIELHKTAFEDVSTNELLIENDKIYALCQSNTLMCYNLKLEKLWSVKGKSANESTADNLLVAGESIYFGGNNIFSADASTGKLNWETTIYDKDHSSEKLLSIEKNKNGILAMTSERIIKINKNGKITKIKKLDKTPIGTLFYCNEWYYFLTKNGNLMHIKPDLEQEEIFQEGINMNPDHRVDDSYFYAE